MSSADTAEKISGIESSTRPVFVVAGVGNTTGTGAAAAGVFAKAGYRVALISRNIEHIQTVADDIKNTGGEAEAFTVASYSYPDITDIFRKVKEHIWPSEPKAEVRVAHWNASLSGFKKFLDVTEDDVNLSTEVNFKAPFAFAREAILTFKENSVDELGRRGTLLFTGATASTRGNTWTSVFASGKFALRALSQSLAKEFGKENIHVAHAVIDGAILTDSQISKRTEDAEEWKANADVRLSPESIAEAYLYLTNQDRSSWTWELDLRPAHEKW